MVFFELLSFSDDEIDLITSSVCCWSVRNHVDLQSEQGRMALERALAAVSSGVTSHEAIIARLDEFCAPPPTATATKNTQPRLVG